LSYIFIIKETKKVKSWILKKLSTFFDDIMFDEYYWILL